jgi:hypothetical protein
MIQLNRLGVPMRFQRPWSEQDKEAVRQYYNVLGPTRLGRILHRSAKSVAGMAERLGLQRSWRTRYEVTAQSA